MSMGGMTANTDGGGESGWAGLARDGRSTQVMTANTGGRVARASEEGGQG